MGLERYARQASLFGRRLLLPDENVSYNLTAIPAAIRIVREEGIDVVITTSPPPSVHFIGAAVKRATGARWVADLRDSIVAHPHRDAQQPRRSGEGAGRAGGRLARRAATPMRSWRSPRRSPRRCARRNPRGPVVTIANGSDFEDFAGLEYTPGRAVPDHARRLVLRQARSAAVPDRALAGRRRRRALRRRLPGGRPRVGGRDHGPDRARPLRHRTAGRSSCSATRRRCCC